MGQLNGTSSVAKLRGDAEPSEQRTFVNRPDSWRALKITIDFFKKPTALGNSRN